MNPTTTDQGDRLLPEEALDAFARAVREAISARWPHVPLPTIAFEPPRRQEHGDAATTVAFALAKALKRAPQELATTLVADIADRATELRAAFDAIEATGGFINLRFAPNVWHATVRRILRDGMRYGEAPRNGTRISLEFGSANPTGPLVVVQGRALSIGDALARAMRACGYDVFTEWIINDAGNQLDALGRSLYARYRQQFEPTFPFPDDGYPGDYLIPIAQAIAREDGTRWIAAPEEEWLPHFARRGRDELVAAQMRTVERFGVRYDLWQSERELHESGRVEAGLRRLVEAGTTYERDGAVYFRATTFGDDKDRVLVRADGRPTYYCADVAYHYEKLQRADLVIDILGPDHHGYIGRLRGLAAALGYEGRLEVLIAQQVTLVRGGEQVRMSKRAGEIVTLDRILDDVGVDAARFFFAMLSPEQPLTFDLDLARERSQENPVYYVQYGHTRIASVLRHADPADVEAARSGEHVAALAHPAEIALIRRLGELPRTIRGVVEHRAPHRLARYARDVATDFHQFYSECRILDADRSVRLARLGLCLAAKTVLARALDLLGVSAPEAM